MRQELFKEKKKRERKINKTGKISILMILYRAILLIFIACLIYINLLPIKYLVIAILVSIFYALFLELLNKKKENKKGIKVLYYIFLIPTMLSMIGLTYGMFKLNNVFKDMLISEGATEYYLVSEKGEKEFLKDSNEEVGVLILNEKNENAFEILEKETKYTKKEYYILDTMVNGLLNKEIEILLLSNGEYEYLNENVPEFGNSTKIIHKFSIEENKEDEKEKKKELGSPLVIYISGIDTRSGANIDALSDVNMILSINPETHKILITNIPRDTYVQLHGTKGLKDKLTHAGIYGIDMSRKTLEDFLDIEIDRHIRVNFEALVQTVDLIGGITVQNDVAFKHAFSDNYFSAGKIHLNGERALMFSRERMNLTAGDMDRGRNQQKVIAAIINKVTTNPSILRKYDQILKALGKQINTDIDEDLIKYFVKEQIDKMPKWNISFNDLKIYGKMAQTYSMPGMRLYVGTVKENELEKIKKEIKKVLGIEIKEEIKEESEDI